MKTIYYAIQNIIRGKDSTLIKVVSLSLGLFLSIILFARVAMELSFDTFYQDHEQLYVVQTAWENKDGKGKPSPFNIYPTGETLMRHFPEQVKGSTVISTFVKNQLKHGDKTYVSEAIAADSLFFQTMGISLTEGNALELGTYNSLFLSESLARKIFGSENPIGKTLLWWDNEIEMTVKGIFEDMPENVTLRANAVASIGNIPNTRNWLSGGNYWTITRLKEGADPDFINQRTQAVFANYLPIDDHYGNFGIKGIEISVTPLKGYHISQSQIKIMTAVMFLLAIVLLLTASFNYVLISISSLAHRAKSVGVHKCSGAETKDIFGMFLWETFFIVSIAVCIAVFLILNFQEQIEHLINASTESMFSIQNLWAPTLAILLLFIIGTILPGRLFSSIPVTQIFRRYTDRKKHWKYPLLFVQFGGTSFLLGIVTIIFCQYNYSLNKDLGWNMERMVYSYHKFDNLSNALTNLRNLPYVEGVACADNNLFNAYQPVPIKDNNGNIIFYPRITYGDTDFCELTDIRLKAGNYLTRKNEIVVNSEFVKKMGWTGTGIGEHIPDLGTVVGVIEEFTFPDRTEMEPFCICWPNYNMEACIHIRLKEPFEDNIFRLNEDVRKLYPQERVHFGSFESTMRDIYSLARIFRDSSMIACIAILSITLLGIIGYTNDEIRRRSKEIAIRKVNGAEVSDILRMLCRDVAIIALPAVTIGVLLSLQIGDVWVSSNFKDILTINPLIYIGVAIVALAFILGTVIVKSWRVANENPVLSIKSE